MADMLSQEEIDALLKGASTDIIDTNSDDDISLTENEKDALGEIGNISMGTAATTLFTLLGHKVTITTPKVSETTLEDISKNNAIPSVVVYIRYKEGLEGFNILVLKEKDVKVITDLMMGGNGSNISNELTELHLSAIGEAMNQMIGSACTSLSEMFSTKIDILPPNAFPIKFGDEKTYDELSLSKSEKLVRIAFSMKVGDIIDSEIMQIIPIDFAKQMISPLLNSENSNTNPDNDIEYTQNNVDRPPHNNYSDSNEANYDSNSSNIKIDRPINPVNVKPIHFESFDTQPNTPNNHSDISLIKDVPLNVTVELGRTSKKISDILDFGPGTVIELDKLVGEPLDILVNGKLIAKGEVVVVDENYGIRITDIISPKKRMNEF